MFSPSKFSVNNSVLINMIMILVFIFGIYTMIKMPKEEMPAIDFGAFYIVVAYPGVSSLEIEQEITKKIEDEISDVDNIDFIQSTSNQGRCAIYVQMLPNADINKAWNDLNTEMDKVTDLPEDAKKPVILQLKMREINPICSINLSGDYPPNTLRKITEDLKDVIIDIPYVSKVDIAGTRKEQIDVQVNIDKLDNYRLTLDDIKNVIKFRNMNIPAGSMKYKNREYIIRTSGEFENINQIKDLVVKVDKQGGILRIKDVATVKDTLEEATVISKLNGKVGTNLLVYKKAEGNIIDVVKKIRVKVKEYNSKFKDLDIQVRNDGSENVKKSIRTLSQNALMGIILVFITLWIFIGWKNALLASWGIPFSFLLTFILMNYYDITINNLTLFALILVLGMIVDDAIIVLENVHRYREEGYSVKEAAIKGTNEITLPVISAVTTTVAAFLPLLLMKGMMGKFMRYFPIVVTLALLSSLFESLIILPSHIVDLSSKKKTEKHKPNKATQFVVKRYKRLAKKALKHRFLVIFFIILALILSFAMVVLGFVRFEFFPKRVPKTLVLNLKAPQGTNLDKSLDIVSKIEKYIFSMKESADIEAVVSNVGKIVENKRWVIDTGYSEIRMDLVDPDKMKYSLSQIKEDIRKYVDKLTSISSYSFSEQQHGPPTGNDIELRVKGDDLNKLKKIGYYIIDKIKNIPGTADLRISFKEGKKEITIVPDNEKMAFYGLTVWDISKFLNTALYGAKISKYRGGGLEEYDIVVKIPEKQINSPEKLKNLRIKTRAGSLVYLKDVVDFKTETGYAAIEHRDGKRIVTITGSTTRYKKNGRWVKRTPSEITKLLKGNYITGRKGLLSDISQKFPGYHIEYGGQAEEQRKSFHSLYIAFVVAILLVYTILGTQFKSYVQPLIVMFAIPFAFIGVIFGLLVTHLPFSLMTLISVVALAGVVVNDSLVLVDFVNRQRAAGVDRWNSLINAGAIRLRPIILTTVTTISGFLPIIFSNSSATADWKPMAVSIAFGLGFATILTLFVIPVIYSLVDSLFGKLGLTRFKQHKSFEEAVSEDD